MNQSVQNDFLKELDPLISQTLFELIAGVCFFAKDLQGRLVMMNHLFAQRCGFDDPKDVLGKTDFDIFPANLAEKYHHDDQTVIETQQSITRLIELFPNHLNVPEWFITNKVPAFSREGRVIGIAGTVQTFEESKQSLQPYLRIAPAVEFIKVHYKETIEIPHLAKMVGLSLRQFQIQFKATLNISPQQFIIKSRLLKACDLLINSNNSITNIAIEVGFYDHSSFTRQFCKNMGLSPFNYKKRYKG